MLTDIIKNRYSDINIIKSFSARDTMFFNKAFRIIYEQLHLDLVNGRINRESERFWTIVHDKLCMEFGVDSLSNKFFNIESQNRKFSMWSIDNVCKNFLHTFFNPKEDNSDLFIKERLSFIELAFREKENKIEWFNELPQLNTFYWKN